MKNLSEDSHTARVRVANAQIGADSLIPHLSTIQEEDEEVICNPGNGYTLQSLIDGRRYTPRRTKMLSRTRICLILQGAETNSRARIARYHPQTLESRLKMIQEW